MACIYRYTDKSDNIIKYVGIVYGQGRTLKQRVKEHTKDNWYNKSTYSIEYLDVEIKSRTDAEFLESHYISLYHTYEYYNKAKAKWGISEYIPDREKEWKEFKYEIVEHDELLDDSVFRILNANTDHEAKMVKAHFQQARCSHIEQYAWNKYCKTPLEAINITINKALSAIYKDQVKIDEQGRMWVYIPRHRCNNYKRIERILFEINKFVDKPV